MNLILLGAPGAGKGTLASYLIEQMGVPSISTGNILREAIKNNTPLGQSAKEYMDAGKLVPDEVIIGVISERLAEADCQNGFILDGVPRTIPQAEALEKVGITFDAVVSLEISDEEIVERMGGRRVCASCGAPSCRALAEDVVLGALPCEEPAPQGGGCVRRVRRQAGSPGGR